jgi:choline dehydrogenase-like flavoprotein
MHIDARDIEGGQILESDLCVVGGGAAGITLAKRLAGTSLEVCLLESGGGNGTETDRSPREVELVGLPYSALSGPEAEYLGGATNEWGGYCAPLDPIVFEERSWVPYSGWPLSREDLDPYYAAAQRLVRAEPYEYDARHWEDDIQGYRRLLPDSTVVSNRVLRFSNSYFESPEPDGAGPQAAVQFGEQYGDDLIRAENVAVVTHANVTGIQTPPSAETVTGLQVECLRGGAFQVSSGQYVLACGGIENPRLLLNANQHAPNGLGNENDLVGRFFMEHPHVPSAAMYLSPARPLNGYRHHFSDARLPLFHLKTREEVQRAERILNGFLRLDTRSSGLRSAQALLRTVAGGEPRPQSLPEMVQEARGVWSDPQGVAHGLARALGGHAEDPRFGRVNVITIAEQAPNPDSRVTLSDERNAFGQRKARLNWQLSALDKRSVVRHNQLLDDELRRAGLGHLRVSDWMKDGASWRPDAPPDPARVWFRDRRMRFYGVWHHMGTTRMADSPQRGVCTPDGRVYGVDNLYVAGASVFPTGGAAPPTLTIVALAARLADHLQDESRA